MNKDWVLARLTVKDFPEDERRIELWFRENFVAPYNQITVLGTQIKEGDSPICVAEALERLAASIRQATEGGMRYCQTPGEYAQSQVAFLHGENDELRKELQAANQRNTDYFLVAVDAKDKLRNIASMLERAYQ